jgi:DNA-binding response OmpR family regulator
MKNSPTILIVEDEPVNREAIVDLLESQGYSVDKAPNGKIAWELIQNNSYQLLITDINMPEMNGNELIQKISELKSPPVILVQTVITDIKKVIGLMREGVYDYISKPYSNQEFLHRVKLAYEIAELRRISAQVENERMARINAQLDWNIWKDKSLRKDEDVADSNLIESIRTSLSQASGFGSLVSLIQILKSKAKLEGDKYVVSKNLMEMIYENGDIARNIVQTFEELDYLLQTDIDFEEMTLESFSKLIDRCIDETDVYIKLKAQLVKFAKGNINESIRKIRINSNYFIRLIKEILYNAYKFSKSKSTIYIIMEIYKDKLKISFLSDPDEDGRGGRGISEAYQKLVFEPFFRISKHVFEQYPTHDYGIGLTFVDKVIRKHGGDAQAFMIKSHLGDAGDSEMVDIEIELPLMV